MLFKLHTLPWHYIITREIIGPGENTQLEDSNDTLQNPHGSCVLEIKSESSHSQHPTSYSQCLVNTVGFVRVSPSQKHRMTLLCSGGSEMLRC